MKTYCTTRLILASGSIVFLENVKADYVQFHLNESFDANNPQHRRVTRTLREGEIKSMPGGNKVVSWRGWKTGRKIYRYLGCRLANEEGKIEFQQEFDKQEAEYPKPIRLDPKNAIIRIRKASLGQSCFSGTTRLEC